MHVLLIHQAFVGPSEPGGTRHFELASRAAREGHRFSIVASDASYLSGTAGQRREEGEAQVMAPGVLVFRAPTLKTLHRSFVWRVAAFLSFAVSALRIALRVEDVSLVMGTTPPIFQAVSAWMVAAVRRCPFVLEVRDLWPEFAIGMGVLRNPVLIAAARALERFLYWRATHILVNSPAYRDYLLGRGVRQEKISFVPNGVDPSMFQPGERGVGLREEWGCGGRFVALYAGALGLANDIPTLLSAAETLREDERIVIVLVGDGKERPRLQAEVERRSLSNVKFVGALPKDRMSEALAASDACIAILQDIVMFRTTYPNKVFDYMAAGRPTVLAIDGVIRTVIEEADGGIFVLPGDPAALARAIQTLADDPVRCAEMGRKAREFVSNRFNREDQAAAFVRALGDAAAATA